MILLAVTGGICDGKSTIVKLFEEQGALTRSADAVARKLLQPGTDLWEEVRLAFAPLIGASGSELERSKLADLIANDAQARRKLNRLMHLPIMSTLQQEISNARSAAPDSVFVAEVPLLIEIGGQGEFDRVLVAQAGQTLQLERLEARIGDAGKAALYLQTQLPTAVKAAFADWVIHTEQPLQKVRKNVQRIWALLSQSPRVL